MVHLCFRSIAETHYQLGVAQAHCAQSCATKELQCQEYDNAEKSLTSAVAVLNARIANLKKLETSENITKELAELDLLCRAFLDLLAQEIQLGQLLETLCRPQGDAKRHLQGGQGLCVYLQRKNMFITNNLV